MAKKIMFNDKYSLTQAVLDGRKTMTRRVCKYDSPYSGQCYKKSFISGVANNVHVNMRCDGKCPRMSNYDKRNGILTDKERTDESK